LAFAEIGITIEWKGTGEEEHGIDANTKKILIQVNPQYYRAIDIDALIGDYKKANEILGWTPATSFQSLVKKMVKHSIEKEKQSV